MTDSGAAANFTVNDAGGNTFSGLLSGALSLTKNGYGALTLSRAKHLQWCHHDQHRQDQHLGRQQSGHRPGFGYARLAARSPAGSWHELASFTLSANRGISLGGSGGTIDVAAGTTLTYNGIAAGAGG